MKILLVGAHSSLALALRPLLVEFAEVVTAGRAGCDLPLDLSEMPESFDLPFNLDVVINTAAHYGGKNPGDMIAAENVNTLGTLRLCHACTRAGAGRLIQVSTIFAELESTSPFHSIYSLSKKHADEAARLYAATFGLPLLILRPSQFYGVGEGYRKNQPFLYAIMDQAQQNRDIVINGSNDARRNFMHVEDVARAIALAARIRLTGTYRCVHPENVRFSQIVASAVAAFESRSRLTFAPERPDIPDNAFDPDDALYQAIGFTPQIDLDSGMRKEAAHRKSHP